MKHLYAFAVATLLLVGVASAQQILTLTTPVSQPSIVSYQVTDISISRSRWQVRVDLTSPVGANISCVWGGGPTPTPVVSPNVGISCSNGFSSATAPSGFATAQAMILALNKARLDTISLEQRIYNQLIADGAFAGTVTGAVQ